MKVITKEDIIRELKKTGLKRNDTVIVHTSLKSMGYVCGGAQAVIEALIDVIGNDGTIMMPAQSWKNLDPEDGVHWDADENDWQIIRDNWPAYDKNITPHKHNGCSCRDVPPMARMSKKRPSCKICVRLWKAC